MRDRSSKTGLFLLEMTLVVFFFALTSAVYVRVFASARQLERDSKALTEATLIAQNLAEVCYASGGDLTSVASVFPFSTTEDATLTLCYDAAWKALPADRFAAASYLAQILTEDLPEETSLLTGRILVSDTQGNRIYELPFACCTKLDREVPAP